MKICLVHDSRLVYQTFRAFLAELGHALWRPQSTSSLLGNGHDAPPTDAFILGLPGTNERYEGRLMRIHEHFPKTPVVVLAGPGATLSAASALENGVFAFVREPVSLQELQFVLTRLEDCLPWIGRKADGQERPSHGSASRMPGHQAW